MQMRNRRDEAITSLRKYRGVQDVDAELRVSFAWTRTVCRH